MYHVRHLDTSSPVAQDFPAVPYRVATVTSLAPWSAPRAGLGRRLMASLRGVAARWAERALVRGLSGRLFVLFADGHIESVSTEDAAAAWQHEHPSARIIRRHGHAH